LEDIECLLQFLDAYPLALDRYLNERLSDCALLYEDLWHIFKPGTQAIQKKSHQQIWCVLQATSGRPFLSDPYLTQSPEKNPEFKDRTHGVFTVDCYHLDFDGKKWGASQCQWIIQQFDGLRRVTSLDFYPVKFEESCQEILQKALDRGKSLLHANKSRHMYYKGRSPITAPNGLAVPKLTHAEDIDSQVIVNFDRTFKFNPEWLPNIGWQDTYEAPTFERFEMTPFELRKCTGGGPTPCVEQGCCLNEIIFNDSKSDQHFTMAFRNKRGADDTHVRDEELVLLPNRVFGFVLRTRKWSEY
jgi:hypothetical protein